jgi:hypothetical protein
VAGMARPAAPPQAVAAAGTGASPQAVGSRGRELQEASCSSSKPLGRHSLPALSRASLDSSSQPGQRRTSRDYTHGCPRQRGSLEGRHPVTSSRRASFDHGQTCTEHVDRVASRRAAMAATWERVHAETGAGGTCRSGPLPAVILEEPSGSGSNNLSLEQQGLWQLDPA